MKEIDVLIADLNNSKTNEQSSMMLENMLNNQRSPLNKIGLGYNPKTTLKRTKEDPKSYSMNNSIERN
jgi:hypothetical protein